MPPGLLPHISFRVSIHLECSSSGLFLATLQFPFLSDPFSGTAESRVRFAPEEEKKFPNRNLHATPEEEGRSRKLSREQFPGLAFCIFCCDDGDRVYFSNCVANKNAALSPLRRAATSYFKLWRNNNYYRDMNPAETKRVFQFSSAATRDRNSISVVNPLENRLWIHPFQFHSNL